MVNGETANILLIFSKMLDMLNREIFKPTNCHIARIVDKNDSLHIYEYDLIDAMNVKPIFHGC